ncbi:hypothetical protein JHW43_000542 [Diplocarpon mali]|nr:hypothetical protein JHW43_000542 [Diplocarpon mali]
MHDARCNLQPAEGTVPRDQGLPPPFGSGVVCAVSLSWDVPRAVVRERCCAMLRCWATLCDAMPCPALPCFAIYLHDHDDAEKKIPRRGGHLLPPRQASPVGVRCFGPQCLLAPGCLFCGGAAYGYLVDGATWSTAGTVLEGPYRLDLQIGVLVEKPAGVMLELSVPLRGSRAAPPRGRAGPAARDLERGCGGGPPRGWGHRARRAPVRITRPLGEIPPPGSGAGGDGSGEERREGEMPHRRPGRAMPGAPIRDGGGGRWQRETERPRWGVGNPHAREICDAAPPPPSPARRLPDTLATVMPSTPDFLLLPCLALPSPPPPPHPERSSAPVSLPVRGRAARSMSRRGI